MGALCFLAAFAIWSSIDNIALGSSFDDQRVVGDKIASSTSYTLTWGTSGSRIVATSTAPGTRVALTVQAMNCALGGQVWVEFNDIVAATNTSYLIGAASSTVTFGDDEPLPYGSVRAMASHANCTADVTEWRLPQ